MCFCTRVQKLSTCNTAAALPCTPPGRGAAAPRQISPRRAAIGTTRTTGRRAAHGYAHPPADSRGTRLHRSARRGRGHDAQPLCGRAYPLGPRGGASAADPGPGTDGRVVPHRKQHQPDRTRAERRPASRSLRTCRRHARAFHFPDARRDHPQACRGFREGAQ